MKEIINKFKNQCINWNNKNIIYNKELDNLKAEDIKLILVADNPGQIEAEQERYLIGPAGISARVYFERAFVSDFSKEVLTLNKTPLHSNTTEELKSNELLIETQKYMVELITKLHQKSGAPIFIMGTSGGLKKYTDKKKYGFKAPLKEFFYAFFENVKNGKITDYEIFGHFSRNMFYSASKIGDYEADSRDILYKQSIENKKYINNSIHSSEINISLDSIFQKWSKHELYNGKGFISDGIINPELYNKENTKVLFVAKEPNDDEKAQWDYRESMISMLEYSFINTIAQWAYGILNNFPDFDNIPQYNLKNALNKIAFMNIKKSGGKGRSNEKEIWGHIRDEKIKSYILEEIKIINPDIIIFSISDINRINHIFDNSITWDKTKNNYDVAKLNINDKVVILINNYHPSSTVGNDKMYYGLKAIFDEL